MAATEQLNYLSRESCAISREQIETNIDMIETMCILAIKPDGKACV
jgi:hypothetical protein